MFFFEIRKRDPQSRFDDSVDRATRNVVYLCGHAAQNAVYLCGHATLIGAYKCGRATQTTLYMCATQMLYAIGNART